MNSGSVLMGGTYRELLCSPLLIGRAESRLNPLWAITRLALPLWRVRLGSAKFYLRL